MPSAKPAYDTDGRWKVRQYDQATWDAIAERLKTKLRPFYPDESAEGDVAFGHPADQWANHLLAEASDAMSVILWHRRRLTNEELRAERNDLLKLLHKVEDRLNTVSHDLDRLFGMDADVLGTRDKVSELIPHVEASGHQIEMLPKAVPIKDAQNEAAVEVAIRCLRIVKEHGGSTAATANMDLNNISDAIQILKILGDEIGLVLSEATWRKVIAKARQEVHDL